MCNPHSKKAQTQKAYSRRGTGLNHIPMMATLTRFSSGWRLHVFVALDGCMWLILIFLFIQGGVENGDLAFIPFFVNNRGNMIFDFYIKESGVEVSEMSRPPKAWTKRNCRIHFVKTMIGFRKLIRDLTVGLNMHFWTRFLSGYYVANGILLASYSFARQYFINVGPTNYSRFTTIAELDPLEKQIMGLLAAAMVIKYVRSQSLEAFFSVFFLYTKTSIAFLTFMMDIRLFAYYVMLYLLLFMMCPQPEYQGPNKIQRLTPLALKQCLLESKSMGVTWLVKFYAAWSPTSIHLEPVFAELSLRYGTDHLRFAKMDLSRWATLGTDYSIDVSGGSHQVPSFILFEKGVEIGRIPHVYPDGSTAKGKYRKADLVKAFELDMRSITSKKKADKSEEKKSL